MNSSAVNRHIVAGFLNPVGAAVHAPKIWADLGEPLFTFDSGYSISMEEANHNVLIIGITGCGKTSTLVNNAVDRAMIEDMGGLVFDVKNNFTSNVRRLAASAGREDDVIEIGSHDTAQPVNILKGYSLEEQLDILESMIMQNVNDSRSADWHYKGTRMTQQVCAALHHLDMMNPDQYFAPSLALIARLINDQELAQKTWDLFVKCMDPANPEHQQLKAQVEADNFTILKAQTASDKPDRYTREWEQQVSWMLGIPRKCLEEFASGSLADNLSAVDGPGLDLEDLIFRQNKIVLVRFSVKSGAPGNRLARMIKERFYNAAYSRFDQEDTKNSHKYVLCIMDEFQDIVHLDENSSLDDFSWVSKAREFKIINVAATQSMSSLYRKGNEHAVRAMLSNFGCKIIMQNDDSATDTWVESSFYPQQRVQELGAGEAIVVKYALPRRRIEVNIETAQNMHDKSQQKLAALPEIVLFPSWDGTGFDVKAFETAISMPVWALESEGLEIAYRQAPQVFSPDCKICLKTENPGLKATWEEILENAACRAFEEDLVITEFTSKENYRKVSIEGSKLKASRLTNWIYERLSFCCHECGSLHSSAKYADSCCLDIIPEPFRDKPEDNNSAKYDRKQGI
ncbi:MAG: type IV secretory system conjugative DNA transfer family protein [Desulfonatronovibrio sp.]